MSAPQRQMHLGVFWLGTGNHSAGWRYDGAAISNCSWPVAEEGARIAERGKFDLFFISDGSVMDPGDHPSFTTRFEPTTLISALGVVTRNLGLGATVSTSFNEPYNVARSLREPASSQRRPRLLEHRHQRERSRGAELRQGTDQRTRPALRDRQ